MANKPDTGPVDLVHLAKVDGINKSDTGTANPVEEDGGNKSDPGLVNSVDPAKVDGADEQSISKTDPTKVNGADKQDIGTIVKDPWRQLVGRRATA